MRSIFAAALLLVISTTIALGQCSETDRKALEAFDHGWTEANARGDRVYLESVYADDYTRTSFTGPANKNEIIEAAVKSAARDKANPQNAAKVTADHFIIACTPGTATITHRSVVTTTENGREQTFYSRGVHFLEKRGGRWQVVSLANHPLDDSTNLLLIDEEWNEAGAKKDAGWFESNLTNDFTWVNAQTGALQTRDDWITAVKNSTSTLDTVESSELKTRVEGDLGLLMGVVHVKGRDARSQPINYNLRFTMTFVKRDGRWLAAAAHATRIQ